MHRVRPAGRIPPRSSIVPVVLVALAALITYATVPPSSADAQAPTGADLYVANCAGCHQVGGEGISGTFPPLAGNPAATDADYVATVITNGKSGPLEVLGVQYNGAMPAISGLSDEQLGPLVTHVVELAGGTARTDRTDRTDRADRTHRPTAPPVEAPAAGDIDRGHDLFVGSNRLDNGGGACASCHVAGKVGNLGGQSLGPDLTPVYQKLGGEPGLTAWLANPASPTMQPIFADRPLTEQEIADLVAFLADAPDQDRPNNDSDWLLLAGLGGLVILIGGMAHRMARYAPNLRGDPEEQAMSRWSNETVDPGARKWEEFYRNRFQHDKRVRTTHGVNCTGSCSWEVFVKDGIVTWELQATDYPQLEEGLPPYEPRGCQRGHLLLVVPLLADSG